MIGDGARPVDFKTAERLFHAARELMGADRAKFLNQQCGDHVELRQRVDELLAIDRDLAGFLEQPVIRASMLTPELADDVDEDKPPTSYKDLRIGPYHLRRQIGAGGMGSVWLADRTDGAFEQDVAVKLIKRGMDSDEILRRFRQERRFLAQLEHPYIARLLDGGETDDGVPYLVMEYIDGINIAEYCARKNLPLSDRLTLFRKICSGVQTAHQNLIVHRDLKPSNILVSTNGVPKLLDFGIAKLLSSTSVPTGTITTDNQSRFATPRYASPEQIRGGRITTSSDVYSLGVVLYEMLTGCHPYPIESSTHADFKHAILNLDPTPPSRATTAVGVVEPDTGRPDGRPAGSGRAWSRRFRGDLDTIVLKSMEKEPEQRYGSVDQFAEDIQRFQEGLPIAGKRATRVYRLRKLIQRNKTTAAVTAFATIALIVATVISARFALGEAEQKKRVTEQLAETRRQASIAQAVNRFLNEDVLAAADPMENPDPNESIRHVLDRAAGRIDDRFAEAPIIEASIRCVLAQAYINLGEYDVAEPHVVGALELLALETAPEDPEWIRAEIILSRLHNARGNYEQAEELLRQQLTIVEQALGADDEQTLSIVSGLAGVLWQRGQYAESIELARRAVAGFQKLFGQNDRRTIRALSGLTVALTDQAMFDEAEEAGRSAYEAATQVFGAKHVTVSTCMDNLGRVLLSLHRVDEAIALFEGSLAMVTELIGEEHPNTLITMTNLATGYQRMQRWDAAEALLKRAIEIKTRTIGASHASTLISLQALADQYHKLGRLEDARRITIDVVSGRETNLGKDHPSTLAAMNSLAGIQYQLGEYNETIAILRDVHDGMSESLGNQHPNTITVLNNIAGLQMVRGQYEEAEILFRDVLAAFRAIHGESSPEIGRTLNNLGEVLRRKGDPSEAEPIHRRALAMRSATLGEDHPDVTTSMHNLALSLSEIGRHDEAAELHEETLKRRRIQFGDDHPLIATSLGGLAHAYYKLGLHAKSEANYREALEIRSNKLGKENPQTAITMQGLARVLREQERLEEAMALVRDVRNIETGKLSKEHPRHTTTSILLSSLLISVHEYEEAESVLQEAFRTWQWRKPLRANQAVDMLPLFRALYAPGALDDPDRLAHAQGILEGAILNSPVAN